MNENLNKESIEYFGNISFCIKSKWKFNSSFPALYNHFFYNSSNDYFNFMIFSSKYHSISREVKNIINQESKMATITHQSIFTRQISKGFLKNKSVDILWLKSECKEEDGSMTHYSKYYFIYKKDLYSLWCCSRETSSFPFDENDNDLYTLISSISFL